MDILIDNYDYYKKVFSTNLRYYMDLQNKPQIDIINNLGVNKSTVSSWCNGTRLPRMDKIDILAKYFDINRSDLLEEKSKEALIISNSKISKTFAHNINTLLSKYDKTQAELATYMNVSQATVSNWCKALKMPRMDKIDRICDFFHCTRSDLIEEKMSKKISMKYFRNN